MQFSDQDGLGVMFRYNIMMIRARVYICVYEKRNPDVLWLFRM